MEIPDKIFFKIGEVSELAGVKPYVLRYWETEFSIAPQKSGSGQRLYRRRDIERFLLIKRLLYAEGFTISGARKYLSKHKFVETDEQKSGIEGALVADVAERPAPVTTEAVTPAATVNGMAEESSSTVEVVEPAVQVSASISLPSGSLINAAAILAELREIRALIERAKALKTA